MNVHSTKNINSKRTASGNLTKNAFIVAKDSGDVKCVYCSNSHKIYNCDKFKKLTLSDRLDAVREAKI